MKKLLILLSLAWGRLGQCKFRGKASVNKLRKLDGHEEPNEVELITSKVTQMINELYEHEESNEVELITSKVTQMINDLIGTPTNDQSLDWDDLKKDLSSSTRLIETNASDYVKECYVDYRDDVGSNITNLQLISKESGLCLPKLFHGFTESDPTANEQKSWEEYMAIMEPLNNFQISGVNPLFGSLSGFNPEALFLNSNIRRWMNPLNPNFNIPSNVLFPRVAGDVVAAVKFAKDHKLQISVKNSGHSYSGSAQKKGTLLINMNEYKQYSANHFEADKSIPPEIDPDTIGIEYTSICAGQRLLTDLSNQACLMAYSRNKPAIIRFGGGENFDKTLRSVGKWNEVNAAHRSGHAPDLHMVSGAVGSVSPLGWTFQGGLPGTQGGRMYGFGTDQVLQIEMIIPNGQHVSFGPVEWDTKALDEGFIYPKTTKVGGVCNKNPYAINEDEWDWQPCEEAIDFDDLWFGQLGGGGGWLGVVTSMRVQLHEKEQLEMFRWNFDELFNSAQDMQDVFYEFRYLVLVDPESIVDGYTKEKSIKCSAANDAYYVCFGSGSGYDLRKAWDEFKYQKLSSMGHTQAEIDAFDVMGDVFLLNDWADIYIKEQTQYPETSPYYGHIIDIPSPEVVDVTETRENIVIPLSWMKNNKEAAIDFMKYQPHPSQFYMGAFAGVNASDQANSLCPGYRAGGYMAFLFKSQLDKTFLEESGIESIHFPFYEEYFQEMYDTSDSENFPGYFGANHMTMTTFGPLKDDWTKPCPLRYTVEERKEKCISPQEAIYGTTLLKRLETIKKDIDPNHMFDCNRCIGNGGFITIEK